MKPDSGGASQEGPTNTDDLKVEVYKSLRTEILKRIEIRYQILNFALVASGAILTFGLQQRSATSLFAYSILGAGLAFAWQDNHNWIRVIVSYLVEEGAAPWETAVEVYRAKIQKSYRKQLGVISIAAILVGTQLITFMGGVLVWLFEPNPFHFVRIVPVGFSFSLIVTTLYMFAKNSSEANIKAS